ncbi:MAG: PAS domain-containing protein [Gammaproteobacteria bacterium]|nr:MAG: PAS domain-containing protein [Gammaproteobacteria bacterium]
MKINEPVTDKEHFMKEDEILVSRTNLKGIITYANQSFIEISGFNEKELLHSNHNMVRHPDMPSAAFEDLWNCLKNGRPWLGYVKNRCKNGDFYWVEANVSPVFRNGQPVEYLSVRYKPTQEQVRSAEALYRQLNSGKIKLGTVKFWQKPLVWWKGIKLKTRALAFVSLLVILGAFSAYAQWHPGMDAFFSYAGLFAMLPLILLLFAEYMNVLKNVVRADEVMKRIAEGVYNDQVELRREDEVGEMLRSLKSMQINMCNSIAEAREKADAAMRIQQALDNVASNVMVADTDYNIIYMNKTVQAMFSNAEADIRKDLPDFNASKLKGANIDIFHKNPAHQRRLLDGLNGTYRSTINVGGRTLTVTVNPVMNENNERRGTVVEWLDRTAEVAVEKEVENIVQAAQSGDLSSRIELGNKDGFFLKLSEGINQMIDVVSNSFHDVARVMQAMAEGDLTQKIDQEYSGTYGEIKDNINLTIDRLEDVVGKIRESSEFIRTSSEEISAGNNNLSQRAEEQASTLEETASSMEQLTSTVRNNADNAQQANQLAGNTRDLAEKGGQVVKQAVSAMGEISSSSNKIAEIIGVIDEIAFQTNLLALNASVEAARAGEQGRGFAVVASEVRNLAQRSAAAAKEIKELINDSVAKVENGSKLVNESGVTLSEIVDAVKKVGDIISEISAASQEQAAGIEQVNKAVTQLDEITQQNAALAEQASASSESSLHRAIDMNNMVSFFKVSGLSVSSVERHSSIRQHTSQQLMAKQSASKAPAKASSKPASKTKTPPAMDDDEWEEF